MQLFNYNWQNFNSRLGFIFMLASLIFFNILGAINFPIYPSGFAALLAWITIILVPGLRKHQYLSGLIAFLLIGVLLTLLAGYFVKLDNDLIWLISLGIISFIGFVMLQMGIQHFMIGWCLVYWYLLAPLFFKADDTLDLLIALITGTGLVFVLNLLPFVWSKVWPESAESQEVASSTSDQEPKSTPSKVFIRRYALVVSIGLMSGVAAGIKWLVTDPSIIANATLNMISPSFRQTWIFAVERAILGIAGIVGGFYIGWYFSDPIISQLVIALCSFFALGSLYVNAGMVVGIFFFLIAYGWGGMNNEEAHLFANEKIVGELIGVAIAVLALGFLGIIKDKNQAVKGNL